MYNLNIKNMKKRTIGYPSFTKTVMLKRLKKTSYKDGISELLDDVRRVLHQVPYTVDIIYP